MVVILDRLYQYLILDTMETERVTVFGGGLLPSIRR